MRGWLQRVLSSPTGVPSTKRHVIVLTAVTLCLGFAALTVACTRWAWEHGDLGAGVVSALLGLAAIVAGLAGSAYRKKPVEPGTLDDLTRGAP